MLRLIVQRAFAINDDDNDDGGCSSVKEIYSCKSAGVWQQERHARHRQIRDQLAAHNPNVIQRLCSAVRSFLSVAESASQYVCSLMQKPFFGRKQMGLI